MGLGRKASCCISEELRDRKKATSDYLTSVCEKIIWDCKPDEMHEAGMGKALVNDNSESTFLWRG